MCKPGDTKEEAERNILDAIRESFIVKSDKGMSLTVETKQVEVAV
jgi:hypothetical protein